MALLTINSKTLELTLQVGVLEEYKPTKGIKEVFELTKQLKDETNSRIKQIIGGTKDQQEAVNKLKENQDKTKEWEKFLHDKYNVDLLVIIEKIREINRDICPDYEDFIKED